MNLPFYFSPCYILPTRISLSPWWRTRRYLVAQPQQQSAPPPVLADYMTVTDWLERFAGPFFATKASFDWFLKRHRQELVEGGALIPRGGRAGSIVLPPKLSEMVLEIQKREALEKGTGARQ